jgi:hypothetical protein
MLNEEDFKTRLLEFSKKVVINKNRCQNEEATKMFLILPFLQLLGYDPTNPNDFAPEHEADFKDKQKARVDYVLLFNNCPTIAIECKATMEDLSQHSGQLRNYFTPSNVKIGILTNGIIYKFFADTEKPNIMDEKPFLLLDLEKIAKTNSFDVKDIFKMYKNNFDPTNIGSEAKKRLMYNSFLLQITQLAKEPNDDFCKMLIKTAGIGVVNDKRIEEHKPLILDAFKQFIENQIIDRLNIAKPKEEVKEEIIVENKIETTQIEIKAYELTKSRLLFLIKEEEKYSKILNITYRDFQTKFIVYYGKEQKGRLFDFYEIKNKLVFDFPTGNKIELNNLEKDFNKLDSELIAIFNKVAELF